MMQGRESHDGFRCKLLRQFHAALVVRMIGLVEIDLGQLLRTAQRAALDLLDLSGRRTDAARVRRRQEMRRQPRRIQGQHITTLGGGQSLRPGDDVLEQEAFQQGCRCGLFGSVSSRVGRDIPLGPPGNPPLAAQQIAVGQRFMRQLFCSPAHQRIFRKGDDVSPEYEGTLAMADRKRPSGVRRRQAGIANVGQLRRWNKIDRRPAQVAAIRMLAASGETASGQPVGAVALTGRKHLEDAAYRPEGLIDARRKRDVSPDRLLRDIKCNRVQFGKILHWRFRHCSQKRLSAHVSSLSSVRCGLIRAREPDLAQEKFLAGCGRIVSKIATRNNGVRLTSGQRLRRTVSTHVVLGIILAVFGWIAIPADARAAGRLSDFISKGEPGDLVPGANRFGPLEGDPAIAPAFKDDRLLGFVYLNSEFANATGYSGKPIQLLVGMDPKGVLTGLKLVEHKEPIVLLGIPEKRILEAVNKLIGADMDSVVRGAAPAPQVDIVSGATVTVLVMGDSIVRSATKLIKSGRLGNQGHGIVSATPQATKVVDPGKSEIRDWQSLVGDGSVARLNLSVADVNRAFEKSGNAGAIAHPEEGDPDATFIDLYVADVAVPTIGRSLLGDDGYNRLVGRLKPGQQALIVAGSGRYSFKGAAYVRGGIFDRIELIQATNSIRFRDRDHTRLGNLEADSAPDFPEIGLFVTPLEFTLDPTEPWMLQLLVQRVVATREKAWLTFDLPYTLPDAYMKRAPAPAVKQQAAKPPAVSPAAQAAAKRDAAVALAAEDEPLWMKIWRGNVVKIGTTIAALGALTVIFFFQNALVRRPTLYTWVRRGYLLFILVWLGWYANAQLSVVNVLTFANSLLTGFSWEYFLSAPLIFLLWAAIAAGLLFWGRGPFCGWLCPFGALQELLSSIAKAVKIPQYRLPWGLHERLWPVKYIIFLGLFGMSLYSTAFAEQLAEVEPFKTAIVLKFARDWPFVIYALTVLSAGLFVERFFCRYMCPLGAALAIPGRIRMFEWLRRWPECGSPCQRCANECPVQAIHPEGHINVNECIYCMHCQELYFDDHRCPHMIQVRLKREKREALSSPSMRGGKGPNTIITAGGKPIGLPPVDVGIPSAT